jgi:hypothetical protein
MGPVHPAYNPYYSACFFIQNSVFLSQQISQRCFSAGLSAQPNGTMVSSQKPFPYLSSLITVSHDLFG